jgi:hypothetical protein
MYDRCCSSFSSPPLVVCDFEFTASISLKENAYRAWPVSASGLSVGVESEAAVGWWQRDHRAVEQVRVKHAEPRNRFNKMNSTRSLGHSSTITVKNA